MLDKPENIIIKFNHLIHEEKIFLKSDLTIKELSLLIGTNYKYISKALRIYFEKDFRMLINEYRIQYAKDVLVSDEYKNCSIDYVSYLCGFKSRTTFYKHFKRVTSLTPFEFRSEYNNFDYLF